MRAALEIAVLVSRLIMHQRLTSFIVHDFYFAPSCLSKPLRLKTPAVRRSWRDSFRLAVL